MRWIQKDCKWQSELDLQKYIVLGGSIFLLPLHFQSIWKDVTSVSPLPCCWFWGFLCHQQDCSSHCSMKCQDKFMEMQKSWICSPLPCASYRQTQLCMHSEEFSTPARRVGLTPTFSSGCALQNRGEEGYLCVLVQVSINKWMLQQIDNRLLTKGQMLLSSYKGEEGQNE